MEQHAARVDDHQLRAGDHRAVVVADPLVPFLPGREAEGGGEIAAPRAHSAASLCLNLWTWAMSRFLGQNRGSSVEDVASDLDLDVEQVLAQASMIDRETEPGASGARISPLASRWMRLAM